MILPYTERAGAKIYDFEDWTPQSELELTAVKLVEEMTEFAWQKGWVGGEESAVFFVGGYPRDLMFHNLTDRGFGPKDVDIATPLSWDQVNEFLKGKGIRDLSVGGNLVNEQKYQTHRIRYPVDGDRCIEFEITSFRGEKGSIGHHPEEVWHSTSLREDASRRDFTINAMYFNPLKRELVDYFGGVEDIRDGILRPVGDARERFAEDPVRMLRYVRFLSRYQMTYSREIREVIGENASALERVSRERVRKEMETIFREPRLFSSINNLARLGLMDQVVKPEYLEGRSFVDLKEADHVPGLSYHQEGNVYRHTLEALRALQSAPLLQHFERLCSVLSKDEERFPHFGKVVEDLAEIPLAVESRGRRYQQVLDLLGYEMPWSVLLHDTGKAVTRKKKGEKIVFTGHAEVSARDAYRVAEGLRMKNQERDSLSWVVEQHVRVREFAQMGLRKKDELYNNESFPTLVMLGIVDRLGNFPSQSKDNVKQIEGLLAAVEKHVAVKMAMRESGGDRMPISGHDVMQAGVPEGPQVGELLGRLEDRWYDYFEEHGNNPEKSLMQKWLQEERVQS